MKYNPNLHNRQSIRLKGYDYSQNGFYFVTICIWQKESLLGVIDNHTIILNTYGEIVYSNWFYLTTVYPYINLDAFMIMPNHIHGIIEITDNNQHHKKHGLSEIIRSLKTFSARKINRFRQTKGFPVWQRGYYEHIIRNETSLNNIREYIFNNPTNWCDDEIYTENIFYFPKQFNIKGIGNMINNHKN
ncbi:MAG: transposase [Trichodesmium sp.]